MNGININYFIRRKIMRKNKVMFLAFVLAVAMLFSLTACKPSEGPSDNTSGSGDTTATPGGVSEQGYVDDGKQYTYRMAPSDLPESWNVHTYQSNSSTYVLDYTSDALYTFEYNDDFTGYKIVPSMAADYPVDVTKDYVGKYGIVEGDENKAYKIVLKDTLTFDNGEKLDANSFVASMKLLLDPQAANFRADNVYQAGQLKIYNAENYIKQNSYALGEFVSANLGADEYVDPKNFTTDKDGILQHNGLDVVIDINSGGNWGDALSFYASKGYFGSDVETDASGKVKIFSTAGELILLRSVEKDTESENKSNGTKQADYTFYDLEGNKITRYINEAGNAWVYLDKSGKEVADWAGCAPKYIPCDDYKALAAAADENGWVKLNASLLKNVQNLIAILHNKANVEAYAAEAGDYAYQEFEEMAFLGQYYDAMEYDGNVGFFAPSANELVIVLKNAMEDNFYLRYELCSSFFLVYAPLYEQCIKVENGVYSNSYGTSVDTYVGFGPYKLTQYTEGATLHLDRNPNWHGYLPGEYIEGTYMTDSIDYKKVTENAVRLEMFLKGEIDSYGLQKEDMEDYISSNYTYFTDSESTWYLAMNPDMENLTKLQATTAPINSNYTVNKTVLTIPEFRQAMSYALDRKEYNQALSPTSGVAKALLSSMIVADPESGYTYRAMDEAKDAILSFWGLSDQWGEGKEYATRDDAIESITGYDPAGAKTLFDKAYDIAIAQNLIPADAIASGKWEVQITIGKPADANYYNNGYEFLKTCWTNAVKGTKFEGHLTFVQSQTLGSTSFGTYLRTGQIDILFGVGYSGSQFDPYSMMDCFTGSLQYDPLTDKTKVDLDVTLNGKTLRASLYDWVSVALQGDKIKASVVGSDGKVTSETVELSAGANDDPAMRVTILAAAECKIMTLANIFPVSTDASASLRCMRVVYKTEEYVTGMGRGGIEWYTYVMDDTEFANHVKSEGGTLNYKG